MTVNTQPISGRRRIPVPTGTPTPSRPVQPPEPDTPRQIEVCLGVGDEVYLGEKSGWCVVTRSTDCSATVKPIAAVHQVVKDGRTGRVVEFNASAHPFLIAQKIFVNPDNFRKFRVSKRRAV